MSEKMMCEEDRLSRLEMGEARGHRAKMQRRLADQRILQIGDGRSDVAGGFAQVELEVVRRLVVARAAGAQRTAERSETSREGCLEETMDILVGLARHDETRLDITFGLRDPGLDPRLLFRCQHPCPQQLPCMRPRPRKIERHQANEVVGPCARQAHQSFVGRRTKAAAPEEPGMTIHYCLQPVSRCPIDETSTLKSKSKSEKKLGLYSRLDCLQIP